MFKVRPLVYWTAQWSKQMFLFLKGSLAMQVPMARELQIEWLSYLPVVSLLIGLAMKSLLLVLVVLVLLSCVPPGKMKYSPCAIISSEGRGDEKKAGLGWRKLKQEGMWSEMDTSGCSRKWREDALKGHIAGSGSLQWRRWFWILVWGVCEVCGESWTNGIGRRGEKKKHETFRRQVGFGSGRGTIPSGLLEFALLSQLPELLFSHWEA